LSDNPEGVDASVFEGVQKAGAQTGTHSSPSSSRILYNTDLPW